MSRVQYHTISNLSKGRVLGYWLSNRQSARISVGKRHPTNLFTMGFRSPSRGMSWDDINHWWAGSNFSKGSVLGLWLLNRKSARKSVGKSHSPNSFNGAKASIRSCSTSTLISYKHYGGKQNWCAFLKARTVQVEKRRIDKIGKRRTEEESSCWMPLCSKTGKTVLTDNTLKL